MISIIIPMYNVEDKIERTLNCIEEQRIKEKYVYNSEKYNHI